MTINDEKIRQDHGSVRAFLTNLGYTTSSYQVLKNKTTNIFHGTSDVFKLKKTLEEHGYISYPAQSEDNATENQDAN